jgi:hypothetical protein
MKRAVLTLAVVFMAYVFGPTTAYALRVPRATLKSLVVDSPVVLIATVVGQHFRSHGEDKLPYTVYSLRLQDVVYGREQLPKGLGQEIELPVFGGLKANGRITTVVGTTKLAMGETYLLFLRGGKWSLNPVSGWNQGALRLVFAGPDIGHVVLSLDGKALMGVKGDQLIFQAPDFTQTRPDGQRPQGKRGGDVQLKQGIRPEAQKGLSDEEELAAERERLARLERREAKLERALKAERREQLEAWLGGQPMTLKAFVAIIKDRRARLEDQIPEEKRSFSFEPVPPTGEGMAPPKAETPAR